MEGIRDYYPRQGQVAIFGDQIVAPRLDEISVQFEYNIWGTGVVLMEIISIIFWIFIGLLYVGVHFQYQELLIGLCALAIGIVQIASLIQRRQ